MKVTLSNGTFTVVSDITKEVVEGAYGALVAKDEKGNAVFAVEVSKDNADKFLVTKDQFIGNTYVDGKLAAVKQLPLTSKEEDVKKKYADGLLALQKYGEKIESQARTKMEKVNEMFR